MEDQGLSEGEIREALAADRRLGEEHEPHLELHYLARNRDDAIQYLELERLPDAVVLDDYLPEGTVAQSASLDVMAYLLKRCLGEEIPLAKRPRAVLWTSADMQLAYTFCVLGGLQFRDKRSVGGQALPVDNVWAALAGRRWRPDPYPQGLIESRRAALPWLEAGWEIGEVTTVPTLVQAGVTKDTLNEARIDIQSMPRTPDEFNDAFPRRWGGRMFQALRDNGWVWVPLASHGKIPAGAPLPLVIDPDVHRESLEPYGPLPARVSSRFPSFSD
ncbi:MAG: hypothetical protein ACOYD4_09470 [Solirubrobacterales bacterium]